MSMIRSFVTALLLAVAAAGAQEPAANRPETRAPARNIAIHFNPAGTQIKFTVGSLLHDVRGTFQLKGGALAIDPDSTLAQGELLVDATTGKTGSAVEDKRLQNEVLESNRYPSIFFHAEHLRGQVPKTDGASDVVVEGMMNIHGADHALLMHVHMVRQGNTLTATTRFTVPYVQWGMKQPHGTLVHLSRQVQVDVTAKGTIRIVPTTSPALSNDSDEEKPD
jgi:polyisoprenoid-binding protein YceI